MKMVRDRTGRFPARPHWEIAELEQRCEEVMLSFLRERYGFERIPVPTEALTELIERHAEFDVQPNLSDARYDVFGYTEFDPGHRPLVMIARELWEQRYRNNRLRMTLGHECGHVIFHGPLYAQYPGAAAPQRCYWKDLLPTPGVVDWMEWQAAYAGGALLMPISYVQRTVAAFLRGRLEASPLKRDSATASSLSDRIALTFDVSTAAATVRLAQLGYLTE
ncbi:MAG TPA: hypothetical protein VMT61_14250 [Candidatus Binataceae bacterium]|nr:hypothetical protein [Candidatus Binataceae bacterium]